MPFKYFYVYFVDSQNDEYKFSVKALDNEHAKEMGRLKIEEYGIDSNDFKITKVELNEILSSSRDVGIL